MKCRYEMRLCFKEFIILFLKNSVMKMYIIEIIFVVYHEQVLYNYFLFRGFELFEIKF